MQTLPTLSHLDPREYQSPIVIILPSTPQYLPPIHQTLSLSCSLDSSPNDHQTAVLRIMYMSICVERQVCIHTYTHIQIHTYIVQLHMYIHTSTHTHIYELISSRKDCSHSQAGIESEATETCCRDGQHSYRWQEDKQQLCVQETGGVLQHLLRTTGCMKAIMRRLGNMGRTNSTGWQKSMEVMCSAAWRRECGLARVPAALTSYRPWPIF